jgi:hypothetical protein
MNQALLLKLRMPPELTVSVRFASILTLIVPIWVLIELTVTSFVIVEVELAARRMLSVASVVFEIVVAGEELGKPAWPR